VNRGALDRRVLYRGTLDAMTTWRPLSAGVIDRGTSDRRALDHSALDHDGG